MTTTTVSTYDFDDILSGLQLFMQSQDTLKDYNFNGSALKALLRVLAYNEQQQAFQNNFVFNELNLDTASIRANVASIVYKLGYFPASTTAASIGVQIVVTPSDIDSAPGTLDITTDNRFFASLNNSAYNFSPDKTYTASLDTTAGTYTFDNVILKQGNWTTNTFTVSTQNGIESYEIPNDNIDTSTLTVSVLDNSTATDYTTFQPFQTAYDLGANANIYFLKENRNGLYELEFGDNRIATQLTYGQVIVATYMVTDGAAANGISSLTPSSGIGGYYNIAINIESGVSASGGADPEDIDTIKQMAPKFFASAGSAVANDDYTTLVKKIYDPAAQVISWGGEYNEPPKYGYTFVCVIPTDGSILSTAQKQDIVDDLNQYNVGSITPVLVDPEYLYLNLSTTVKYVAKKTILSQESLKGKISSFLKTYSNTNLKLFASSFDISQVMEFINSVDKSITGNYSTVVYEKQFTPVISSPSSYSFEFLHAIEPGSVTCTGFRVSDTNYSGAVYSIVDNGSGVLSLVKVQNNNTVVLNSNFGTVNYNTGVVSITQFAPNSILSGTYLSIYASPAINGDPSISGVRHTVLQLNSINVTLEEVNV